MASKKTKKKPASKTKTTRKPAAKTAGQPRTCGECGKLGHNARSHAPGGRLAKK